MLEAASIDVPAVDNPLAYMRDEVWIVVAAYNEELRLRSVLQSLCARYRNVVVVDDGSSDRTSEIAASQPVWRLCHLFNLGQGAALQTGIDFALSRGARYLVTFDADGQHRAEEIDALVEPLRAGKVDLSLGSRFLGEAVNLPWHRYVVLKLGVLFTRIFSRVHVTDTHNGLRAMTRDAAEKMQITQNGMAHASEILDQIRRHHLRFAEVPVTIHYSDESLAKGQSSWGALRIGMQFLLGRLIR